MNKSCKQVYDYVFDTITKQGYCPSVREICSATGLSSTASVHSYIKELIGLGYLESLPGKRRTLKLANTDAINLVPVLGNVAAGTPIFAAESYDGYVAFSKPGESLFALNIKGDSMINAGILDGDKVIVERTQYADKGDIVVALIDNEATCKRLIIKDNKIILIPENDNYKPITAEKIDIIGKVVGLIREY